ncbi:hypothetical protein ACFOGI_06900 [Virgibacillus xinjiangensis]|uniref:N-terminal domain of peptidoglycan hydrolase CwlO-containing protein n=1 Tax=Virgibacillus xinjiangensis TaxID=393090 RepID=A0ABV7CUF3_9BACI
MDKLKSKLKSKKLWYSVSGVVVLVLAFVAGQSSAQVLLGEEKVKYTEVEEHITATENTLSEKEEELSALEQEIQDQEGLLESKQKEVDEANKLIGTIDELKEEKETLQGTVEEKEGTIESLDGDISAKEEELAALEEGILNKSGEPIELGAGEYIIGADIPAGRYTATNIGEGSNFFVRDASGYSSVNTILGDDWYGDYTFFGEDGETIETAAPVKLIPVE